LTSTIDCIKNQQFDTISQIKQKVTNDKPQGNDTLQPQSIPVPNISASVHL